MGGRLSQPRERAAPEPSAPGAATTADLALTALRAGLVLMVVVAASDCVAALALDAGALVALQGTVLIALALAGVVRTDAAARLLRPRGRVIALAALFGLAGAVDFGLYEHFGGIAGALVCIAALVGSVRRVALCLAASVAAYLGAATLAGHSPAWMAGDGSYDIALQLVNFVGNAGVGVLMVAVLRSFIASAPQRLADVHAGGRSLTPQLALAAGGRTVALLPAADVRTLIAPLTRGERDVVALLAAGRVPKQAAHDLSIALATVRSRIASAKRKTGARTLDQLVAMYAEAEAKRAAPRATREGPLAVEARLAA
jgi:DNA-binding CsgD family transcriptional regulator